MKQKVIEPVLGICLLAMVVMAVKYGSIRVTGSGDAYIKETPVVVVDAGHGGTDPGKVGVDGSLEKDINLAVAERLKTYLEQDDVKVIMTRETDTGLYSETDSRKKMADMKKRCEIIEESGADLVVSIHQNSYHEESVSGGQVFYYRDSSKGKALAKILQDRFDYVLGDQNRRLPKANANYYLLLHVKCPIVIVECGFLSNRKEAGLLNSGEYQDKLAYTIHMGIMEYLKGEILGGNSSLSKVQSDLNLTRTLVKYGLSVEWESGDPETVSDMGLIGSEMPESGKTVTLRAGLMNGSSVTWVEIPVTVFPETETLGETFSAFLGKLAEKDLETGQVVLPETFDGRTLHYRSADGCGNGGLIFLGIAAALCLFLKEKSDAKEAKKQWEDRMILDYPELLSDFVVLTGAGYPVRQAWKKQVVDAESKNTVLIHPVYREMRTALNQMETGTPEIRAYGEFGRRIGLGCYIKFASLLGNSVSTGGKDLRRLLEEEMETAFRQRKELALRKGEEASTKLLIPMFLMLGVVMVMVVAPAFLSL